MMPNKRILFFVILSFTFMFTSTVNATYVKFGFRCGSMWCPGDCKYDSNAYYNGKPCSSYEYTGAECKTVDCTNAQYSRCIYLEPCLFHIYWSAYSLPTSVDGDVFVTLQSSFQLSNSQTGNTLQPKATNLFNGDETFNVQTVSVGEYFEPGGSVDSPPIYFNSLAAKYSAAPQIDGGNCGAVSTKFECNTTTSLTFMSLSTGNVTSFSLKTGNSFSQSPFSLSSLSPDDYNMTVERSYDCAMSGYATYCPQDRPGKMNFKTDNEWYLVSINDNSGTCDKGCNPGFFCCQNRCRNSTKGVCRDLNGNGILVWVTFK